MNWMTIRRVPERCFWAALLFSTVYQSYRYPLQMNSAGTSPTYSDTPVALQAAKFLFVLPACLISAQFIGRRRIPRSRWMLAILVVFMCLYPLLKACFAREQLVGYVDVAFWPMAALALAFPVNFLFFLLSMLVFFGKVEAVPGEGGDVETGVVSRNLA